MRKVLSNALTQNTEFLEGFFSALSFSWLTKQFGMTRISFYPFQVLHFFLPHLPFESKVKKQFVFRPVLNLWTGALNNQASCSVDEKWSRNNY